MGTPTGGATWNLLADRARDDSTGAGTKVWWKVAGAGEPSTYGFTQGSSADGSVSIIAVQDGSTNTPIVAQTGGTASGTSKATPSTTPNGSDDFEIRCVALHTVSATVTFTPPSGFTERTDIQSSTFALTTTATRTLASGGATGTHNFTCTNTVGEWHGFTVNIGSPSTAVSLTDTSAGTDALTTTADAVLADAGSAADVLAISADTVLAETLAAVEDLTVQVALTLEDVGNVVDDVGGGMPVDVTDTSSSSDTLTIQADADLADSGPADDQITASITLTLADAVAGADDLTAVEITPKSLTDAVTAAEALSVLVLEDLQFTPGPLRRGWGSPGPARDWDSDSPARGWTARTLTI
ncbi:hypothetical protein [Nonomuraea typhae]|uniref:Uncharacterized protein n=1 Tax=Nonomuraea typhae TaxID=2603600 RepID=A0ABW7YMQ1_9ACTN